MSWSVRVDSDDLRNLSRTLRDVADGKQLRRQLTADIRDVLRPTVAQVRAAYRGLPGARSLRGRSRGDHPALRSALARSTRMEVRTSGRAAGVRLLVDGRRMPEGMRSLPKYVEGTIPRWRHPVFGDRDVWAVQPAHPTFYPIVRAAVFRVARRIDTIATNLERDIVKGH